MDPFSLSGHIALEVLMSRLLPHSRNREFESKVIPPEEDLWDITRVAAFLGVSKSWLYHKTSSGLIPYLKIGGQVRFVPSELRAWAAKQRGEG